MPAPATPKNINVTAFRVLSVLRHIIHHGPLTAQLLNTLLTETPEIGRGFGSETLTKYINSLRYLGCDIPRATSANQFEYNLKALPFAINLSAKEGDLLAKAITTTLGHPECTSEWVTTWQKVVWAVNSPESYALQDIKHLLATMDTRQSSTATAGDAMVATSHPLLGQWQQYCKDRQALAITFAPTPGTDVSIWMDPDKLITKEWGTFLAGTDRQTGKTRIIHLSTISHVRQLPIQRQGRHQPQRVRFRLYGKLARSYRLYPGEAIVPPLPGATSLSSMPATTLSIDVLSTVCEIPVLLHRLLKYGPLCQVLSPESAVDAMRTHIAHIQQGVALAR